VLEPLKVLVVDDNEEFCGNVVDILELKDYKVVTANSGLEAIELVRKGHYDLVLMDVRMPGLDGSATFREIKEITPETPVVMVTAFAVEETDEALREGAVGALRKPLDFDRLFELIEQVTVSR
jgi:CheY-like chemotaxis protein